jgi:hypothetical protein
MQLIYDNKMLNKLFVFKAYSEKGIGLQFRIFNYRNVLGFSSHVKGDKHVVLGDFEKKITKSWEKKIKEVMIDNNMALLCFFKSSPGKYHFYTPQVFDWLDAVKISKSLGAEKNFLSISAVREQFILRISKKGKKDEPVLMRIFHNEFADKSKIVYSKGHSHLLEMFYKLDKKYVDSFEKIGKGVEYEKYRTTNVV